MRPVDKQRFVHACFGVATLVLAACGGSKQSQTSLAPDETTGAEVAAPPPSAVEGAAAQAAANPWGSPEADKGAPLPPRKPMSGSARTRYDDGIRAAKSGDLEGAQRAFEQAVGADDSSYEALHALAVINDRQGKEAQALDYYRRALRVQADYEESARGVSAIYVRQGQPDRAVSFMQPLAAQWERNLLLQAYYADLLVQLNRQEEAIRVARAALKRDERFVPAMISLVRANIKSGKVELADSILEQALAVDEKNATLHHIKGTRLLSDGKSGEALNEFRRAVELDPDFAEARMDLAMRLLAGANYDDALTQLQAVDKLTPRLVEVQLALGEAYRSKRQWEQAKAAFDRAIRMRSDLPQAHFNLALMYMTAGAEYPGLDVLGSLGKAKEEFATYRSQMGSRITRDDASLGYLDDIEKSIAREQKRIEREKKAAERGKRTEGGTQ